MVIIRIRRFIFIALGWLFFEQVRIAAESNVTLTDFLRSLGYVRIELVREGASHFDRNAYGNHLFLDAQMGGKKQKCLLDTGWSVTCLNRAAGKRVQSLAELHSRVEDPILGTTKGTNFVLIKQLVLGQIELLNQPFMLENANSDRWPLKTDIILGIDLLRRCNAIIDLLGGSLFLRIPPPDVRTSLAVDEVLRRSGWSVISLAAGNSLCLFTEAKVAGEQFRLLVDSGAAFSELDLPLANRLGLKLHRLPMPITGVGGRAAEQYSSQVPVLELGELSLTNAPVGVANLKLWQAKDGQRFDGLIGADWLGLGQGVLDCHSQRLYLKTLYQGKN